jgi:uncharacterized iron-regulated protein
VIGSESVIMFSIWWNFLSFVACAVLASQFGGCAAQADEPRPGKDFEATLRKLEKDIAAVRGLEFKSPVAAKVIARPKDALKAVQGYYSTKEKTLYVYDDIAGVYERGVLIHEMVHALQDQHFGLEKLHQTSFSSDADLALAALVEGDATFTMIELLKQDQPKVSAILEAPLEKAGDIQKAFLYAQGARYVKAVKERGGWAAVNSAYRFPPRSTASILHPEGAKMINLGPGTTRGEFAIVQMLAAHPDTAPQALQSAAGWKADRVVEDGKSRAWIVAYTTPEGAQRFQKALVKLRLAQNVKLKSFLDEPDANGWHDEHGNVVVIMARGERTYLIEAPDETAYKVLFERVTGPAPLRIYSAQDRKLITFGEMIDRLQDADLICVGETHDSELDHQVQFRIIKALFAADERLGVGMEMFQRPFQKEIDRYFKGALPEEQFLKATEYKQRWGYDWGLYRPIVEFCRRNDVPLAALNAPKELTSRISKVGVAGLSDDEKKQLGDLDFHVKAHRDYWYDRLAKLHGNNNASDEDKEIGYQIMTTWDGYMAASAALFQQERRLRRLIILAGSGHIDRGFGIPARAAKLTGGKAATIHIEVDGDPEKTPPEPVADFSVYILP